VWAIVPFKALEAAKQRLASLLTPDERRDLMLAMARDVLAALCQSSLLTGVLIVSRTAEADALARAFATERFSESPDADLPGALRQASSYLREHFHARGVMVIPADVPLITAAEIDQVIEGHGMGAAEPAVTVIPDSENLGTNCLILSPPHAIDFIFDGRSFRPHVNAAFAREITPKIAPTRGFQLDIDTADDLRALLATDRTTQTGTFLDKSGIAGRLSAIDNGQPEITP
jgi:2-phospho-L-lactate guanylyltransferase